MATVRDIAHKANVSIATVSRVLSNKGSVNTNTRRLVLQTAQELGYTIAEPARNTMVSPFIPVLIRQNASQVTQAGRTGESFEQTVWAGIETVFARKKVLTKLQIVNMTVEAADHFASEAGVAGLILLGGVAPNDFLTRLQELRIPFVIVGSHARPLKINSVMADVFDGMRQVVRHLVAHNRCRIGFINGPATTKTSEAKLDGLQLELDLHGLALDCDAMRAADFSHEAGYQATRELLVCQPELQAIIYADDMIALGGMRALTEAGVRVPQDIAVTGFGDYELSKYTVPALTTVHYDMHAMGRIAATRLYQMLQDDDHYPWSVQVPASLVIRESV